MISLEPKTAMTFGGTTGPAAFVDRKLAVPKGRVFIDFRDLERSLFGWNGNTF